jgi:hypothetical protein
VRHHRGDSLPYENPIPPASMRSAG